MRPVSFSVLILLVISTLSACPTLAATIHVPADQPTIQAGIGVAVSGDLVLVSPGTYVENINFLGKAITLQSETGAEETIIDGGQNGSVVLFDSGETGESVLGGFTIRNGTGTYLEVVSGYWYYCGGGILCATSSSPEIENSTITENNGTVGGGVAFIDSSLAKIINCTIYNNSVGTSRGVGGGIGCFQSSPTITSCRIFGNETENSGGGTYYEESSPTIINCLIVENNARRSGGGIRIADSSSAMIAHCTISANNAEVGTSGISCSESSLTITTSIVWGNYLSEISTGCSIDVTYSDIKGGWAGEGNIDADPLFVRASDPSHIGDWDYHLYFSSPCVDSGTDAGVYTDMDGSTRPLRAGFDMGVYEYPDCVDSDGDGYGDHACGGYDCDDANPAVNPGAQEVCDNEIDDDCDDFADMDDLDCGDIQVPLHFPTIQAGINAAPEGSVVLVAPGTYMENITFQGKAITVRSDGGAEETIIDGRQNGSVVRFEWAETDESVLDGFTITNGKNAQRGGGIYCDEMTAPVIQNCIITRNQTYGMSDGAGIYCHLSSPTILNCLIKENWTDSRYDGSGAGIYSGGGLGPTIKNSTIIGNIGSHDGDGGGIYCQDSSLAIEDSAILENIAGDHGGGIKLADCYDPPVRIIRCTISGNYSSEYGGGMHFYRSPGVTVEDCVITDNFSEEWGGGISCYEYSEITVTNSILSGNQAHRGGGLYLSGQSHSQIANCIITENSALSWGGGICMWSSDTLVENCTIAWNQCNNRGGGIHSVSTHYTLLNSIVWGNSAPNGTSISISGNSVTASYSDVLGGEEAVYIVDYGTVTWQDGMIDEDPLFAGEKDYRLGLGSPCIDTGNPDSSYSDSCFPPSIGTELNDMGGYGGPGACHWCGDHDGDGYESVVCGGDDCNDAYAATYPGAEEICDGQDNDCDDLVPVEETDADGDGWLGCLSDCDDSDAETNPFGEEICDGADNDCDGIIDDRDADEDGYIDEACGGEDCDDTDSGIHPGATEVCDGKDSDCDGILPEVEADVDSDGWAACMGDCDDTNPAINPDAEEICEGGLDEDCDGLIDIDDTECGYTLELEVAHEASRLYLDFVLGTPVPAFWTTYFISFVFPTEIIPLWSAPIPAIMPAIEIPISFDFPWTGSFFVYSGLRTLQGLQAYDIAWGVAEGMD